MKTVKIGNKIIGTGKPALVIGEVAMAHDGSLGLAHAFIDAIAETGADAVKFQTHLAEAESTFDEKFRVALSSQDKTRYDYWKRTQFSEEQWTELAKHAVEKGLIFLSSPFSLQAFELLNKVGVPAWKVASGEITNMPLIEAMVASGKPLLISAGMSPWEELDRVVRFVESQKTQFALFQCTTAYPCPPEAVGLNVMQELRSRYDVPTGLSDHSGTIYAGLAATTLGANMIEVHVTLSRDMSGPDVAASLTPTELGQLIEGVRAIETMLASPIDKDKAANEKKELRKLFFHSVVASDDLPAGTILRKGHLVTKKPGNGYPAEKIKDLFGRKLKNDLKKDQFITEEDLAS